MELKVLDVRWKRQVELRFGDAISAVELGSWRTSGCDGLRNYLGMGNLGADGPSYPIRHAHRGHQRGSRINIPPKSIYPA